MRHYILASHGTFAQGIYESVKIILGAQEHVHIICAYVNGENDIKDSIKNMMDEISVDDEIIACTDIFGGSVNNEMMNYITRPNFYLVAGMSLPLLMNLFLFKEENPNTLIHRILPEITKSIVYCNKKKDENAEEEDF